MDDEKWKRRELPGPDRTRANSEQIPAVIEVEISHSRSEHVEMLPPIHYVNGVVCACADRGGGSNGDVKECVLERIADLALGVVVRRRRGKETCPG